MPAKNVVGERKRRDRKGQGRPRPAELHAKRGFLRFSGRPKPPNRIPNLDYSIRRSHDDCLIRIPKLLAKSGAARLAPRQSVGFGTILVEGVNAAAALVGPLPLGPSNWAFQQSVLRIEMNMTNPQ